MAITAPAPGGGRKKSPHLSKQNLSACQIEFVELMQSVNFGCIKELAICNGEPILDPQPVIVRKYKFSGENGPRTELGVADFLLKQQVVELFEFFDSLRDGVIAALEIKHGLPFLMEVTEVPA